MQGIFCPSPKCIIFQGEVFEPRKQPLSIADQDGYLLPEILGV